MIISNITPPQVWSASSRSLTNIGSGALASTSIVTTSLAGAASVDIRPSVGIISESTVAAVTGAAATLQVAIQLSDGTSVINLAQSANAANANVGFYTKGTNSVWPRLTNADATHAATYIVAQSSWTI